MNITTFKRGLKNVYGNISFGANKNSAGVMGSVILNTPPEMSKGHYLLMSYLTSGGGGSVSNRGGGVRLEV